MALLAVAAAGALLVVFPGLRGLLNFEALLLPVADVAACLGKGECPETTVGQTAPWAQPGSLLANKAPDLGPAGPRPIAGQIDAETRTTLTAALVEIVTISARLSGLSETAAEEATMMQARGTIAALPRPQKGKRDNVLNEKGRLSLRNKAYGDAIALFERARKAAPADEEIVNNLAFAELKAGQYQAAREHLLASLLLNPRRANAWANLAELRAVTADGADTAIDEATAYLITTFRFSGSRKATQTYLEKTAADTTGNPTLAKAAEQALARINAAPRAKGAVQETPAVARSPAPNPTPPPPARAEPPPAPSDAPEPMEGVWHNRSRVLAGERPIDIYLRIDWGGQGRAFIKVPGQRARDCTTPITVDMRTNAMKISIPGMSSCPGDFLTSAANLACSRTDGTTLTCSMVNVASDGTRSSPFALTLERVEDVP